MYFQVIMPVGSNPSFAVRQSAILSVAEDFGIEPRFPTYTIADPQFDFQKMLNEIGGSEFVIADLSLERPSCYYELGIAEALGQPVHLIASDGTDIHQTANRSQVNFYSDNLAFLRLVRRIIRQTVETPQMDKATSSFVGS